MTCAAAQAASGCDMPPACRQEPSGSTPQNDQNKQPTLTGGLFILVEMRGVEPLSESTLTKTSPGADGDLHSLA